VSGTLVVDTVIIAAEISIGWICFGSMQVNLNVLNDKKCELELQIAVISFSNENFDDFEGGDPIASIGNFVRIWSSFRCFYNF
jgi:hypothetical protein